MVVYIRPRVVAIYLGIPCFATSGVRLSQNRFSVTNEFTYVNFNSPYTLADLQASHRFNAKLEALLQVQNLADKYINDYMAQFASLGRQVKLGARIRM